jgi:chromosome segregation ATPase
MLKTSVTLILAVVLFYGCGMKKDNERLTLENQELQTELTRAQMAVTTLEEVGVLMDSIDNARDALKLDLEAGTNYEGYLTRMKDLNDYVVNTEAKISQMEQELSKSSSQNQTYVKTIQRLKGELAAKATEITEMQASIEKYKQENTDLLNIVDIKESEITDLEGDITAKKEELSILEARIQEMMKKAQISEADSYFALGEATEEAANRTKLAPKKKKETLATASEYYKKSLALGRTDAQVKIDAIEKKL